MRNLPAVWVLVLAFALTHGLYQVGRAAVHPKQGLDFAPEYIAARLLVDGDLRFYEHPVVIARGRALGISGPAGEGSDVVNYAYPPWLPVLYLPLSRLPYTAARLIWLALSIAATFGACAWLAWLVAPSEEDRPAALALGLGGAAFFFPIPYGLMAGQANDLPLLGIVASFALLRSGRPFLAGLVLAPAGLWKIFTGFPVLVLLARREWRAIGGLALGCAGLIALSLPLVGVDTWLTWVTYIRGHNSLTEATLRNHSIWNAALLWLTPSDLATPLAARPDLAPWVARSLAGACLLALAAILARPAPIASPLALAQWGTTLLVAVCITPRAWEHYGVYLLPAFAGVVGAALLRSREEPEGRAPRAVLALAGVAFLVWGLFLQFKEEYAYLGRAGRFGALVIPAKLYASLLLLGLCGVAAWWGRGLPVDAPGDPAPAEARA